MSSMTRLARRIRLMAFGDRVIGAIASDEDPEDPEGLEGEPGDVFAGFDGGLAERFE